MKFHLLLTNPRKTWWLLLYLAGWAALGTGLGLFFEAWSPALTRLSPWLDAGSKVLVLLLFVGALYGFERLQATIREPVCLTIWPDGLVVCYQQSGRTHTWQFAELRAYQYQRHSRLGTFLRLVVRGGKSVRWRTGDFGFTYKNTEAFAAMAQAFEAAWARYQQAAPGGTTTNH